jgi:hypothetical protein
MCCLIFKTRELSLRVAKWPEFAIQNAPYTQSIVECAVFLRRIERIGSCR